LQNSENRFHSAFTHAAIGMVLVSTDRHILQANRALSSLLEKSEVELIGTELTEIVHPDDVSVLRTQLTTLLDGPGTRFTVELRCRHSQGLAVWVLLDGSFFSTGEAEARCLIIQAQDVTARRRAESRLQHIAYHDGLTNLPKPRPLPRPRLSADSRPTDASRAWRRCAAGHIPRGGRSRPTCSFAWPKRLD